MKFRQASRDRPSFLAQGGSVLGAVAGASDEEHVGVVREAVESG